MQINKNDKFVATKDTFMFSKGDIVTVTNVDKYGVWFEYGKSGFTIMDKATFENHFEKFVEKKEKKVVAQTITAEHIQNIVDNSEFEVFTVFDKCTLMACKLPNGFVIVESSACVSEENYNVEMGAEICFDKIVDKIWELEGYKLQDSIAAKNAVKEAKKSDKKVEKKHTANKCWETDLDCDDCLDIECMFNPINKNWRIT